MQASEEPAVSSKMPDSLEPKPEIATSSIKERVPHLHAKTFLTVFAVCLIYFAQLINLVGTGAVCVTRSAPSYTAFLIHLLACSRHLSCCWWHGKQCMVDIVSHHFQFRS
jgi:hypothetical protein